MNSPLTASGSTPNTTVVFPPDRSGIGTLAVFPPLPVGYKLLPNGVLGVNINMVHSDRDGLLIYILAYLNMAVGDWIKVYLATKNKPVVEFPITDAHFESNGDAKNIPCHIPAADMESIFAPQLAETKDIWVEVRRISDNSTEDSPHAPLSYIYPAPAEPDTDGGKPFNQGMKLPVASEQIIDLTVINNGMFVTILAYFNQQIGDIVVLTFGSLFLEQTVTALGDIEFELTPEMLATLKPTVVIIVRWEVFDVVENSSGWSDALEIVFKPGIALLVAPIFELADMYNVVHHDWLAGGPMSILITGIFAIGDVVLLLLEGVTEGGEPVSHSYSIPVSAATRTLRQDVENFRVQNLIRGSCRATYTLDRAGNKKDSKPADITIDGGRFTLGQPTVKPLDNNDTVPVDTLKGEVQFADYWPLKPGARVQVLWQTVDDAGVPVLFIFQQIVTDETRTIAFEIIAKYIGKYPSSSLVVQCEIINPNRTRVVSEPLQLKIGDEKAIVLDPPMLVGTPAPIDPLGAARTMRVEYPAKISNDRGRLVHVKAPTGSMPYALTDLNSNNRANWTLDNNFLVAFNGQTVRFRWNLNRNNQKIASSKGVDIEIMPIAPQDARLPLVTISGVEGGVVDTQKLTPANRLVADPWIGQREGQAQHLQLGGIGRDGKETFFDVLKGKLTGDKPGLDEDLPITWLKTLKDLSTVHMALWVNVDGTTDQASALEFPKNSKVVDTLDEKMPAITSVSDPQGREVPQNSETIAPTVTVRVNGTPLENITILLNGVAQTTVTTDAAGNAFANVNAGNFDAYNNVSAKAVYGQGLVSPPRSWIRRRPLYHDATRQILDGYVCYTGWAQTGAAWPGQTRRLVPKYGVGTIRFSSSNPAVLSIDASGLMTGRSWGAAWIYIQDVFTTIAIYVDVINIYRLVISTGTNHPGAVNWMNSIGGIPINAAWAGMMTVYGPITNWPHTSAYVYWMCESAGCPAGYAQAYHNAHKNIMCSPATYYPYQAWCMVRA